MSELPRIVITGFMGVGKTTVTRALARRLACEAVDLDDLITAREGRTPRELIVEDGEPRFREAETRALRESLESGAARIIALGGGAWTFERNRALIAEHGAVVVWLDAPFDLCWRRITNLMPEQERPLAPNRETARALFEERRAAYQLAPLRVKINEASSVQAIAAEIADALCSIQRDQQGRE